MLFVCRPAVVFLTALPLRISLARIETGISRIPSCGQDQAKKRQDQESKFMPIRLSRKRRQVSIMQLNHPSPTPESVSGERWSAVGSMALCVSLLIASEFMPVSLLTPIAHDLRATDGMAGQAISISGLFAVITSFFIATLASRFDRRHVLLGLTAVMLLSLVVIAMAPNFLVLMVARALLGIVIGGFWSLATATVMRLVQAESVPKALGLVYTGNAVATAFAAPIGSYVGGIIGWRGVFWAMTPIVVANLIWLWVSLPVMPPQAANPVSKLFLLLRRRHVAFAMVGVMFTFAGAFATFTYLRPFLETYAHVSVTQLSLLLLALGVAGFVGTYGASNLVNGHLYSLLTALPVALGAVTLGLLGLRHHMAGIATLMFVWGALNSAIPVCWSTWLSRGIGDEPESGGGLMVGAIQLAIMLGGGFGGLLLDHISIAATFIGGAVLLVLASLTIGKGQRIQTAPTGEIKQKERRRDMRNSCFGCPGEMGN